ncbi:hypothetical protein RYX36_023899 [Vicia faba]
MMKKSIASRDLRLGKSNKARIVEPQFQMTLAELLDESKVVPVSVYRNLEVEISRIQHDSRLVTSANERVTKPLPEPNENEQVLSKSALNKLIGVVTVFDLEEKEAPKTLMCSLKPYQIQALYWMTEIEKGADDGNVDRNLHPCWSAYNICKRKTIYVIIFAVEMEKKFPQATHREKGGIMTDVMGFGKTIMIISLTLRNPGRVN